MRVALGGIALAAASSLGLTWGVTARSGYLVGGGAILTNRFNPGSGDLDLTLTPMAASWVGGDRGQPIYGFETPARVLVVPAVILAGWLCFVVGRGGRPSPRPLWGLTGVLAAALVLAIGTNAGLPIWVLLAATIVAGRLAVSAGREPSAATGPAPGSWSGAG